MQITETQEIIDKINDPKIKLVTFSPDDLLVTYPFWKYEDIYLLLQKDFSAITGGSYASFKNYRKLAQQNLVLKSPFAAANIKQIYDDIAKKSEINSKETRTLREQEIRLAEMYCRRREYGCMLFEEALRSKKKIAILSDSVFTKGIYGGILESCGITGYSRIYTSGGIFRTKKYGGMFRRVIADYGIEKENMLHIGCGEVEDYAVPKQVGINAIWVPSPKKSFSETPLYSYIKQMTGIDGDDFESDTCFVLRAVLAQAADNIFNIPSKNPENKAFDLENLGFLLAESDESDPIVNAVYRKHRARVSKQIASSLIDHAGITRKNGIKYIADYIHHYTSEKDSLILKPYMTDEEYRAWRAENENEGIKPEKGADPYRPNKFFPMGSRRREVIRFIFKK